MVVFDRLLARLAVVGPERWVLKGALALDLRFRWQARTTMDVDLGRHDDEASAERDLRVAQAADLGDWFAFAIERTTRLEAVPEVQAIRYHVTCELAGRLFDHARLDVAFGHDMVGETDLLQGLDLLAFAGIEPIRIPAVPLTRHVAEKLHAYTRSHAGGIESTRVKDLVDLVLIASLARLDAERLRHALDRTFEAGAPHTLPDRLPHPPRGWTARYRRMAAEVGLTPDLAEAHTFVASLLDPVLSDRSLIATWDPSERIWR